MGDWWWWISFKELYNLTFREPENRTIQRACTSTRILLDDFYDKAVKIFSDLNILENLKGWI